DQRLTKDAGENTTELACLAALPALAGADTAAPALAVVQHAIKNLSPRSGEEPWASLVLALADYHLERGDVAQGKKRLAEYVTAVTRVAFRTGGDNGQIEQFRKVARTYTRFGLVDESLDLMGKALDALAVLAPNFTLPPLGSMVGGFGRQMDARPA